MPHCLHCSYELVLLEHRHKYKCALCSKLYRQKDVENKEFRRWNGWQRQLDLERLETERKSENTCLKEQKKALKSLFSPPFDRRQRWQMYYKTHKEKELLRYSQYNETHRDQRTLTHKKWTAENKEHLRAYERAYAEKNKGQDIQKKRMAYWRSRQKALALLYLKNEAYKPTDAEIFHSVSTSALSHLLEATTAL